MNKQIDDMAKDLCRIDTCAIRKSGIPCNHRCKAHIYATRAIDKGYRRASDVAREMIEEIKASSSSCVAECNGREIYGTKTYTIKATKLDEILKKYESEGWDEVQPS